MLRLSATRPADLIDGAIGEASMFHATFGYYAQGVVETTAVLPDGWRDRLIPFPTPATMGVTAWCLEARDLWIAKAIANRPRDLEFCTALVRCGLVDTDLLVERLAAVPNLSYEDREMVAGELGLDLEWVVGCASESRALWSRTFGLTNISANLKPRHAVCTIGILVQVVQASSPRKAILVVNAGHLTLGPSDLTREVVEGIAPLGDLDQVCDRLGEIVSRLYKPSFFAFSLWDEKRRLFVERVSIPRGVRPVHLRIEDLDDYGFGIAVKADSARLVSDIEREGLREGEWRARKAFGTRSYVTIPLHVRGRVAGALGVGSSGAGAFQKEDVQLLRPTALVLGMKAAELGVRPPLELGRLVSILPGPVLLAGTDERLMERVVQVLPAEVELLREDLSRDDARSQAPSLTLYCTARLGRPEARQIGEMLRVSSQGMVVLCRETEPEATLQLMKGGSRYGLLAIQEEPGNAAGRTEREHFAGRIARWIFRDACRPDWMALGVPLVDADVRLSRVMSALEREPFRNWKVRDLAREAAMSTSTLSRVVKAAVRRPPSAFIRDFRFHILDRFRRSGELPASHVHSLFGFSSAQLMYEWCRRYQERARRRGQSNRSK